MFLGVHLGKAWCMVLGEKYAQNDPKFLQWFLNLRQSREAPGTDMGAERILREELSKLQKSVVSWLKSNVPSKKTKF